MCLCLALLLSRSFLVCALSVSVMFAPMMGMKFSGPPFVAVLGCSSVVLFFCLCSLCLCHVCSPGGFELSRPISLCLCLAVFLSRCFSVCAFSVSVMFAPMMGFNFCRPSLCVRAWLSFCRVVFLSVLSPSLPCLLP